MNLNHKTNYAAGDQLTADAWNKLAADVNELGVTGGNTSSGSTGGGIVSAVDATAVGGDPTVDIYIASGVSGVGTPNVIQLTKKKKGVNTNIVSKNNINLEPRESVDDTNKGGNISLKPGDDIEFCSHHRIPKNRDEVSLKVIDGDDKPVKLQLNASEMLLTTKGKDGDNSNVFDVTVNSGTNTRGYLKVRAQAIDLRSESHGGIALQPKGKDSSGNINKIKFEHGGGDGLEFGTFNTEKTSIFTDEYRFNKNGVWKMATRITEESNKADVTDSTTALKYQKQPDDFYDVINVDDETATTNAIIKTAHALNDGKNRHAKYTEKTTSKGALKKTLELETVVTITFEATSETTSVMELPLDATKEYTISDFKDAVKAESTDEASYKYGVAGDSGVTLSVGDVVSLGGSNYTIVENFAPSIDITAGEDLSLDAKAGVLSLGGDIVEFGSDTIDLGEMEDGIYAQYKLTKKGNNKPCDVIKIKAINNGTSSLSFDSDAGSFAVDSFYPGSDDNHPANVSIPAKVSEPTTDAEATQHIKVVAQCKLMDVIKFVTWAKKTSFGPWAETQPAEE